MRIMDKSYRILVVDDEEDICEILKFNLESENYKVDVANSAEEALLMNLTVYQLILLDVMMEEISGFAMAKEIKTKEKTKNIPIIFLTAKNSENATITGFTLGADDYISKPFSIREVLLRVKAVLRRSIFKDDQSSILIYENMRMDSEKKKLTISGKEIALTKIEFELLHFFLSKKGKVYSREILINQIWPDDVYVTERTVDVNITRLRKKIDPYGKSIVTKLGYGYYLEK